MEFSDLARVNILFIVALSFLVNACSMTKPFVDRRRDAAATGEEPLYVGRSTPEKPAICYNALSVPFSEVKKLATEECRRQKTGSYAVADHQTVFTCRLLVPNHFYFNCVK